MSIITFDQFKEKFNKAISEVQSKANFIDNEIREIDRFLFSPNSNRDPRKFDFNRLRKNRSVFDLKIIPPHIPFLAEVFQAFYLDGGYDDSRITDQTSKSLVEQARQLCHYYQWLKEIKLGSKSKTTKSSLTHKQKMLALHYLGLDLNLGDNTKLAKILSEILELSEDNTRQYLTYLSAGRNDVRTKSNLSKVNQLFKKQGFESISDKIESDLEKL